ncbi:hypothetical protein [Affinirhizobium pseudoryzae]|uniref:hypothetical protein n=1 Tax=Allorhizobium pseudoryzae TaxID=379684 RepID=UPI0013EBFAF7|nr:hypothetical protein [Allorhizobium pseudoryzae]
MSNIIDLIAYEVALLESVDDGMVAYAWYDGQSEVWRSIKRASNGRYPANRRGAPMTQQMVDGPAHLFAMYHPYFEKQIRRQVVAA